EQSPVPVGGLYVKIDRIRRPSATIQFIEMAYTGEFAAADHPHVENWQLPNETYPSSNAPIRAAKQLQINPHRHHPNSWESTANYGFLDGHAESLRFRDAFESYKKNQVRSVRRAVNKE